MFYKYLKLVLFSTLLLQASPKVFNSLGDELEAFQKDCKTYQNISSLPAKIKNKCHTHISKTNQAFKIGYELDPYIDSDNMSERKLNKYLGLIRNLDKSKEDILNLIYSEARKARKQNNTKYYSQLIANNKIKLYSSDYEFMEKNIDVFEKNQRYLSHIQYMKNLAEQRKNQPKEYTKDTGKAEIYQLQKQNIVTTPIHNTNSIIMKNCRSKWGTNYRMVKYCVKQQQQSFNSLKRVPSGTIKQQCTSKWGTNYRMIKYCVEQQTEAFNYLENTSNNLTKEHCENKWGTNYRMVKHCMGK